MFVRNRKNIDFKYNKSGKVIVLKANTVTLVDDSLVTAKELINCYGQRIEIIGQGVAEAPKEEVVNKEVQKPAPQPASDKVLEDILEQVQKELDKAAQDKAPVTDEDKINEVINENTEVKAFLEGEINELPEGTEEIDEDEVNKLLLQVEGDKNTVVDEVKEPQPAKTVKADKPKRTSTRGRNKNK